MTTFKFSHREREGKMKTKSSKFYSATNIRLAHPSTESYDLRDRIMVNYLQAYRRIFKGFVPTRASFYDEQTTQDANLSRHHVGSVQSRSSL